MSRHTATCLGGGYDDNCDGNCEVLQPMVVAVGNERAVTGNGLDLNTMRRLAAFIDPEGHLARLGVSIFGTSTTTTGAPMNTDDIGKIEQRPPLRERDHILNTAKRLISGDRQETYGEAIDDFTRTGKIWAAILGVEAVTAEQVALCMAAVKIGRLCNTPNHNDSWVDACGYLALGGDIAATDGRHI